MMSTIDCSETLFGGYDWTRANSSSSVGFSAIVTSSLRRYSDIDMPALAARTRITAWTSSGTFAQDASTEHGR